MQDPSDDLIAKWTAEAVEVAQAVIEKDTISMGDIKLIGGLDISFVKGDDFVACASLVVIRFPATQDTQIVYEEYRMIRLEQPYIPGYLAFREAAFFLDLLENLRQKQPENFPDCILVDGQGVFHPHACGVACHIGVKARVPAIGVGKTFLQVDSLVLDKIKADFLVNCQTAHSMVPLVGASGRIWGAAVATVPNLKKPIFVSVGHGLSLETALQIVWGCSRYRQPEPIRCADQKSREFLAKQKK